MNQDDEHAALEHEQELERQWWDYGPDSELWKRHRDQLEELKGVFNGRSDRNS